ncbi:hypothetical protein A2U01_0071042, partial [Trifolium medium]|nr:hypothetical protein [Trifolium medium]
MKTYPRRAPRSLSNHALRLLKCTIEARREAVDKGKGETYDKTGTSTLERSTKVQPGNLKQSSRRKDGHEDSQNR